MWSVKPSHQLIVVVIPWIYSSKLCQRWPTPSPAPPVASNAESRYDPSPQELSFEAFQQSWLPLPETDLEPVKVGWWEPGTWHSFFAANMELKLTLNHIEAWNSWRGTFSTLIYMPAYTNQKHLGWPHISQERPSAWWLNMVLSWTLEYPKFTANQSPRMVSNRQILVRLLLESLDIMWRWDWTGSFENLDPNFVKIIPLYPSDCT